MYQFWLNTPDRDVGMFLKYFTFLPISRIEELEEATRAAPERREAQRLLAQEVTALVHGVEAAREARATSAALFGGESSDGRSLEGAPGAVLPAEAKSWPLWKLVAAAVEQGGVRMSTSEVRRLIKQGGVEVDGTRAGSIDQLTSPGPHTVKIGKRRIYRVIVGDR
jgi:tyrosyl-tRNA synthetase